MTLSLTAKNVQPKQLTQRGAGRKSLAQVELIRPRPESKAVFLRSLSTMVLAGVTIDRALTYLGGQTDDLNLAQICSGMAHRVQSGMPLSQAMNCYPRAFSRLQLRMVQMGEKTGLLDQILLELSRYEEKERALVLKIRSTLGYPSFILVVATLLMLFVPPYIMKGMFSLIDGSGVKPPLITLVVMRVTEFLRSPLFYVGFSLLAAASWYLVPRWLAVRSNQRRLACWVARVPGLGKVYHTLGVARFSRALSVQIECGMNPLNALPISAEVSENPLLIEAIEGATENLSQGAGFASSLETTGFFPNLMLNMVKAGEESASLGELLRRTAELYEQEVDHSLDTFTALLEPAIMIGIGTTVGILVLATMLPMTQVIENIH